MKYISFYRLGDCSREFLVFPNPGSAIALFSNHTYQASSSNSFHSLYTPSEHSQMLQVNRTDAVRVIDDHQGEAINIVFHPFGVNQFLPLPLKDLVGARRSYIPLEPAGFGGFATKVFEKDSSIERLEMIEAFLVTKLQPVHIPCIKEAIGMLSDLCTAFKIPEICQQLGTTPRTLNRLFKKHLCISPVEFRNICQFRCSFDKKWNSREQLRIKEIVYDSNYSHPSHMVRMYRRYTGFSPSSFFERVAVESNFAYISLDQS